METKPAPVGKLTTIKLWFIKSSLLTKVIVIAVLAALIWFGYGKIAGTPIEKTSYQTAVAEKGTLIVSITASGAVSTANNSSVTTQSSGVVTKIYAPNGTQVKAGDPIAELDLDQIARQKYSQALASYQSAKNNLNTANNQMYSLQAAMFKNWDTFRNLATNSTYQNSDGTPNTSNRTLPEFIIANNNWLASEQEYKNQQNVIVQAQNALNSAWLSYQQSSPIIYAPIAGEVTGLSLQIGSVIAASTSNASSTTTSNSQKVASVKTTANPTITINLTEIDITKVKVGDKATITLDAFADKTFTGRVVSVDTVGTTSSGVSTYPIIIALVVENPNIYPNMSASASIITASKDDVLKVPTSAVQTQNGESTVRVMKNGQQQTVAVETGIASDTEIEIVSGLKEGDTVVTGTVSTATSGTGTSGRTQSPFGGFGGGAMGGNVRVIQAK